MKTEVYRSQSGAIRAASFDAVFLTVMTGDSVSDAEFDDFLRWGEQFSVRVSLSWVDETQLTATQRNRALKRVQTRSTTVRSAMVTESKIVQGIVTAFSWFVKVQYGAFLPTQTDAAFRWLCEAYPFDIERARRVLQELRGESKSIAR